MLWVVRILLCLLLLAAGWRVVHQLVGYEIARLFPTPEGLVQAIEWDGENPDPHHVLGVMHRDQPEHYDLERSRRYLEKAVELNPYYWPYWLDLARTYEISGATDRAGAAYQKAVQINPRVGLYRWRYANYLLRAGKQQEALLQCEKAIQLDPREYLLPVLDLLWRSGVTNDEILSIWPSDKPARLALMRYMIKQESSPQGFLAAQWEKLVPQSPTVREGDFYIRYLLDQSRFEEARLRWEELAGDGFETEIWDGRFQREFTGGTLGWVHDRERVFRADEGVRVEFDGTENIDFNGFRQRVVVQPGAEYELRFRIRAQEVSTEQGLYFQVVGQQLLLATEQVLGTMDWTDYSYRFRVPSGQHLITVGLRRKPSKRIDNRLKGVLWLEFLQLQRVY